MEDIVQFTVLMWRTSTSHAAQKRQEGRKSPRNETRADFMSLPFSATANQIHSDFIRILCNVARTSHSSPTLILTTHTNAHTQIYDQKTNRLPYGIVIHYLLDCDENEIL